MKTYSQFCLDANIQESPTLTKLLGPGVGDWERNRTSIQGLAARQRRQERDTQAAIPINQSSYEGRVEAGRNRLNSNKKYVDNPDFVGSVLGAGKGTKDRMPGTTSSSVPRLSDNKQSVEKKFIKKQTVNNNQTQNYI